MFPSAALILQRNKKLRKREKNLDNVENDAIMLSPAAIWKVDLVAGNLAELDEVTKDPKYSHAIIRSVWDYSDAVLEDYSDFIEHLDEDAWIL